MAQGNAQRADDGETETSGRSARPVASFKQGGVEVSVRKNHTQSGYQHKARRIFKCKGCTKQFSVTTATIFASRKLPLRDILAAIAIFVNGANPSSVLSENVEASKARVPGESRANQKPSVRV